MLSTIRYIWIEMRPRQWAKNVLIYAGLVFSQNLTDIDLFAKISVGFILLSLTASSIYIINDVVDLNYDKKHPEKRFRPLAAGNLAVSRAILTVAFILPAALFAAFLLNRTFFLLLSLYFLINLVYSLKLKQIVILDIGIVSFCFVIRVLTGTVLAEVDASHWLIMCTFMVSLFLGFSKRRQELILAEDNALSQRKVLAHYSVSFLDQMISTVTACTVISYSLYTISAETVTRFGTENLLFTVPFVLYGVFRYLYLIYHANRGENPTDLVTRDIPFVINVAVWSVAVVLIIY